MEKPIRNSRPYAWMLWIQLAAFAALASLAWANELLDLPFLLFGGQHHGNWREATVETIIVLLVGLGTVALTEHLRKRLVKVERFVRICSWCRKVSHAGEWITLEAYLQSDLDLTASHGICPACLAEAKKELAKEKAAGASGVGEYAGR